MKRLTQEEILLIHFHVVCDIQKENAGYAILNYGTIESVISIPFQTFDGMELYPSLYQKAAIITENIISGHPFQDGNKRVGITAGCVFLLINGCKITASEDDVFEVAMKTANGEWHKEEIVKWFEQHVETMNN